MSKNIFFLILISLALVGCIVDEHDVSTKMEGHTKQILIMNNCEYSVYYSIDNAKDDEKYLLLSVQPPISFANVHNREILPNTADKFQRIDGDDHGGILLGDSFIFSVKANEKISKKYNNENLISKNNEHIFQDDFLNSKYITDEYLSFLRIEFCPRKPS